MNIVIVTIVTAIVLLEPMAIERGMSSERFEMAETLLEAPAWFLINRQDLKEKGPLLVSAGESLEHLSVSEFRNVISEYVAKSEAEGEEDIVRWSKLHVIFRIYFNVPQWEKKTNFKRFSSWSWAAPVERDEYVNSLYPLGYDEKGSLVLQHQGASYLGPSYNVWGEFDYFEEKYGKRNHGSVPES